jgi:hypothetical protein
LEKDFFKKCWKIIISKDLKLTIFIFLTQFNLWLTVKSIKKKNMKKILVIILAFNQAQLRTGRMVISLNANYNQNSGKQNDTVFDLVQNYKNVNEQNSSYKQLNAVLNFGYFISNNIVVGLTGNYQYMNNNIENNSTYNNNSSKQNYKQFSKTLSGGIYARYYKMIGASKFAAFAELKGLYLQGNSTNSNNRTNYPNPPENSENNTKLTGFNVGIRPGITYFINDKFGIETSFGNLFYQSSNSKNYIDGKATGNGKTDGISASLSLSTLYFGVSYYFGGKKEVKPEPIK